MTICIVELKNRCQHNASVINYGSQKVALIVWMKLIPESAIKCHPLTPRTVRNLNCSLKMLRSPTQTKCQHTSAACNEHMMNTCIHVFPMLAYTPADNHHYKSTKILAKLEFCTNRVSLEKSWDQVVRTHLEEHVHPLNSCWDTPLKTKVVKLWCFNKVLQLIGYVQKAHILNLQMLYISQKKNK